EAAEGRDDREDRQVNALRRFRDRPIRHKISIVVLAVSGVAFVCAFAAFLAHQWSSAREGAARRLEIVADVVGDQSTAALEFGQRDAAAGILRSLRADPQVVVASLYDEHGELFSHYVRSGSGADAVPARPAPDGTSFRHGELLVFR